jgi:SAM-dependent methyltransferase
MSDAHEPSGRGRTRAPQMLAEIEPLFRGRRLAVELGSGSRGLILGLAGSFERLRGVDASPELLERLTAEAAAAGITNIDSMALDEPWEEPTGAADYVVVPDLFPSVHDRVELANYLQRIAMVLRRGGIVQARFDSRPRGVAARLGEQLGIARRGERSFRRKESWVRDRMRGADFEIIGERGGGTAQHWVVARRR